MSVHEDMYANLLMNVLSFGEEREGRNGITKSLFEGNQLKFDLTDGVLPVITIKRIFLRGVFEELMFFLRGQTDNTILKNKKVNIWNANTSREFLDSIGSDLKEDDMGPMYGFQWRHFNAEYKGSSEDYTGCGFDQLSSLIEDIRRDPYSRRLLMTAFNPLQVKEGCLPPCHGSIVQFNVNTKGELNCHMYQRSADLFLGVPWNITSYALLVHIIAKLVNLKPGKLIMTFGDVHIYKSHYDATREIIDREPYPFPTISFKRDDFTIEDLQWEDLVINNYRYHPNDFNIEMVA